MYFSITNTHEVNYKENDSTYRCMPPSHCVPVVKNNLVVTRPLISNGRITSQSIHLTAELPNTGSTFDITRIIGRCVGPCSCADDQISTQMCGADGRTYDSQCHAECAGTTVSQMLC